MDDDQNDYDRISAKIDDALAQLTGNTFEPAASLGDTMMVDKDSYLSTVIRLQRLRDWVEGLAESHKNAEVKAANSCP